MGFGKDARFYDIEGAKYPSVTTILSVISKPALYKWYEKKGTQKVFQVLAMVKAVAPIVHEYLVENLSVDFLKSGADTLTEAGGIGTQAHSFFERFLKGEELIPEDIPESVRPSVLRFLETVGQERFEVVRSEAVVYSKTHGYAGTLDAIIRIDDRVILRDWKTSSGIYPEYSMQAVAYKKAAEEMSGERIDDVEIIRFSKTGEPFDSKRDRFLVPRDQHEYLFSKFLAAFELWKWQAKQDSPKGGRDVGRLRKVA